MGECESGRVMISKWKDDDYDDDDDDDDDCGMKGLFWHMISSISSCQWLLKHLFG